MIRRNSETRKRYLETMGITLWYPRVASSVNFPDVDLPETTRENDRVPQVEAAQPFTAESGSSADPVFPAHEDAGLSIEPVGAEHPGPRPVSEELPVTTKAAHKTTATAVMPATPSAVEKDPVFIQHWWIVQEWLVIDTRDKATEAEQARKLDRLILDLTRAMAGAGIVGQRIDTVDWPLFENPAIKCDLEEVHTYLGQKWEAVSGRHEIKKILLMGEQTPRLCGFLENCTVPGYSAPAATELCADPTLKPELWGILTGEAQGAAHAV